MKGLLPSSFFITTSLCHLPSFAHSGASIAVFRCSNRSPILKTFTASSTQRQRFFSTCPNNNKQPPSTSPTASPYATSLNMSRKLESPSAERNKEPIWQVLNSKILAAYAAASTPSSVFRVLEIAAGAGVHTAFFSQKLAQAQIPFQYFPTDPETSSLASIQAYLDDDDDDAREQNDSSSSALKHNSVNEPLTLTLTQDGIREADTVSKLEKVEEKMDLVININMIHISPWSATLGLMKAASQFLKPGGTLFIYGPYRVGGTCVESNLNFDQFLKAKDPTYGVRNLEDVIEEAKKQGLAFVETIEMPANNLSVIFRKQ